MPQFHFCFMWMFGMNMALHLAIICIVCDKSMLEVASMSFKSTDISITSDSWILLGCPIDIESFIAYQVSFKIYIWNFELSTLSDIAKIHPTLTYSALIHGMCNRQTYLFKNCPTIHDLRKPLKILVFNPSWFHLYVVSMLLLTLTDLLLPSILLEGMSLIDPFHSSICIPQYASYA